MKPRRTVDAVAIEQRKRRVTERRRPLDERLGKRRALQETERRGHMEFDVHRDAASAQGFQSSDFRIQIYICSSAEGP